MSDRFVQDFIEGFTKAARAGGRLSHVQPEVPGIERAYAAGKTAALQKFAAMSMHDGLDLAGLGMLGAPLIHDVATDGAEEAPWLRRSKKITELAGLATLAASTLSKLH